MEEPNIHNNQALDFEEYTRVSEPHKWERAYAWRTAIGLQAVDGLQVSDYLKQTARRNIEGEITIDEARELIKSYYQSKPNREPDDDEKQEADKVSGNISRILSRQTLDFTANGFVALHRRIFELRNRYLLINVQMEEKGAPISIQQIPNKYPTRTQQASSKTEQAPSKFQTDNSNIIKIVLTLGHNQLSVKELMQEIGLKDRVNFLHLFMTPAIKDGFVRLLFPDKPKHPRQKYLLTEEGFALYNELKNK